MENDTGLALEASLTHEQRLHLKIMSGIARNVSDTPLVLKGGTALLLAYGLDRFSEDLDFDSEKAINLYNRINVVASQYAKVIAIDVRKDTNTVLRYRLTYGAFDKKKSLKIEVSFRQTPEHPNIDIVEGIKVYKLPMLVNQKLKALESRTVARDLYDITFLITHHKNIFNASQLSKLQSFVKDLDALEKRFIYAFSSDAILAHREVSKLVLSLHEAVN